MKQLRITVYQCITIEYPLKHQDKVHRKDLSVIECYYIKNHIFYCIHFCAKRSCGAKYVVCILKKMILFLEQQQPSLS